MAMSAVAGPSRGLSFSRPMEFDPTLARRTASQTPLKASIGTERQTHPQSELATALGLDIDEPISSPPLTPDKTIDHHRAATAADEAGADRHGGRKGTPTSTQKELAAAVGENTRLRAEVAECRDRLAAQEERIEEMKKISAHSKQLLISKFKAEMKSLMTQLEEQKAMLQAPAAELSIRSQPADSGPIATHPPQPVSAVATQAVDGEENRTLRSSLEAVRAEYETYRLHVSAEQSRVEPVEQPANGLQATVDELTRQRDELLRGKEAQQQQDKKHTEQNDHIAELIQQKEALKVELIRLQDLQSLNDAKAAREAQDQVAVARDQADKVENLQKVISNMDALLQQRENEMVLIKEKAKEKLTLASDNIKLLKSEYSALRDAYKETKDQETLLTAKLQSQREDANKVAAIKHEIAKLKQSWASLQQQTLPLSNQLLQHLQLSVADMLASMKGQSAAAAARYKRLEISYKREMKARKLYFNMLQELRGNIRVFARIRPSLVADGDSNAKNMLTTSAMSLAENELFVRNPDKQNAEYHFEYDTVFNPAATQSEVYTEVSDLILSCLDGYNVCIFAYGQTGSGKTYTMQGTVEQPGVNIRALSQLFTEAQQREQWTYNVSISLIEIYNETIRDLLSAAPDEVLKAREANNNVEIPGLTVAQVVSSEQVMAELKKGSKNRNIRSTAMNDQSSRSHLILSIYIRGKNQITNQMLSSKLHLIDLAGSERVSRSGVTGDALKEAVNINSSLSALGNVIAACANKQDHVPYRDSTLTWLLKDSLEKQSKCLMFVQISPDLQDLSESLCTLKFAARAREVELGKAQANITQSQSTGNLKKKREVGKA